MTTTPLHLHASTPQPLELVYNSEWGNPLTRMVLHAQVLLVRPGDSLSPWPGMFPPGLGMNPETARTTIQRTGPSSSSTVPPTPATPPTMPPTIPVAPQTTVHVAPAARTEMGTEPEATQEVGPGAARSRPATVDMRRAATAGIQNPASARAMSVPRRWNTNRGQPVCMRLELAVPPPCMMQLWWDMTVDSNGWEDWSLVWLNVVDQDDRQSENAASA